MFQSKAKVIITFCPFAFLPFCLDAVLLKKLACKQAPMLNCGTGGKTMRDDVPTQWLPIILASLHSCFGTLAYAAQCIYM